MHKHVGACVRLFGVEVLNGGVELEVGVHSVDQLVPQRVLGGLPAKRILLRMKALDLLCCLFQPSVEYLKEECE